MRAAVASRAGFPALKVCEIAADSWLELLSDQAVVLRVSPKTMSQRTILCVLSPRHRRAGIVWSPIDSLDFYFSYAQTFKPNLFAGYGIYYVGEVRSAMVNPTFNLPNYSACACK
jgi:hypothetical protein